MLTIGRGCQPDIELQMIAGKYLIELPQKFSVFKSCGHHAGPVLHVALQVWKSRRENVGIGQCRCSRVGAATPVGTECDATAQAYEHSI